MSNKLITAEPALKPCPRCGWKGYIMQAYQGEVRAICSHCEYKTAYHEDRVDAIREWNEAKDGKAATA